MARIEDSALIGDRETAALVGMDDYVDWLCLPRFGSGSNFPQTFSHVALVSTAHNLAHIERPSEQRRGRSALASRDKQVANSSEGGSHG